MRQVLILFSLMLIAGGHAVGQESYNLSLNEAQEYALEYNRTLKNASLDIQKTEASRWQTIASILPQINASVDYQNMLGYSLSLQGFDIAMPANATLGVTTAIAISSAQIVGLKLNDIALNMSDISLKKTEQMILDQVKSIYYSTLVMEETVTLLEENLANIKSLAMHTEQSVKVGLAEQTDADQISVQVVTMETTISATRRSLEMLYNSMRLQLGLGVNTEIILTQTISELLDMDGAMALLGQDFNVSNNYDYQLMKQNVDMSKTQVQMQQWAYAPSISIFHQYSYKKYFSDEATFNMTPPNMIGFSLSVPIFSSFNRRAAVREAKYSYEQQLNTLSDTEESMIIQYRQLSYNLSSAFESYEAQKKNIEVTQRVFDNITRKYENGMASSLDVTTAGTNLINAQSSYVQALMEIVTAQIALDQLLNKSN